MMRQNAMSKGLIAGAFIVALTCMLMIGSMLGAGKALAAEETGKAPVNSSSLSMRLGHDIVWAGDTGTLNGDTVENDMLAAGRVIKIEGAMIGGSIRAAAQEVVLRNSDVTESVTLAGELVEITGGRAFDVCTASRTASFKSETTGLHMYGETIYIDGVVHGDAIVTANKVEIGPNAVIEGTLDVTTASQPVVDAQAKIGKLDVKIEDNATISGEQAKEAMAGFASTMFVFGILFSIVGALIIAVLSEWLFKRHTAAAAMMIRQRTGATIGSGIIGALVAPIVVILLICFVITLPVAGILTLALIAMSIAATGFMGASVFKLAFKNMGRFKVALLGGLIMGVASAVPFLGSLVSAAAFMYFLGYVLQTVFLSITNREDELGQ